MKKWLVVGWQFIRIFSANNSMWKNLLNEPTLALGIKFMFQQYTSQCIATHRIVFGENWVKKIIDEDATWDLGEMLTEVGNYS